MRQHWISCAVLVLVLCSAEVADAQLTDFAEPAISIERLWAEPGPGGFIAATDAQVLPVGDMSFGFLGSLMSRPLVLRDISSGEEASVPVKLRLGYELSLARGVTKKLQLGVALPLVAAQDGDRLQGIGLSEEGLAPIGLGDLRVHAKLRLQEDSSKAYDYAASFYIALPTGDDGNFAGERGSVLSWTLIAAYRVSGFHFAANLGVRLRTSEVILISPARPHGNELIATIAGEYSLPKSLDVPVRLLVEVSQVEGDDGGPSPGEWRAGAVADVSRRLALRVAAGRGYTADEVGAPNWRMSVLVDYALR